MKIFIRYGHDILTNGTCTAAEGTLPGTLSEWSVIREYAPQLAWNLYQAGHQIRTYGGTEYVYSNSGDALMAGINDANSWDADLFISCHANAYNGSATGSEVLYKQSGLAEDLAEDISSSVASLLGITNRGKKYATNKGELNYTDMPAVIIEPFFVDNPSDCGDYDSVGGTSLGNNIASTVLSNI